MTRVLRTPFYQFHVDHGAKFVDYNGWELPIMYRSIHEEHRQVRNSGGIFDVSHMGRIKFSGRHARRALERLCTRRVSDMAANSCRYSLVCNERGGVRDDVLIYRFDEHWLMVCNAANREKILEHVKAVTTDLTLKVEDQTTSTAMVAVQGPKVMEMIGKFSKEIPTLKRYTFAIKNLLILKMTVSRTGYTGEDGVEVILNATMATMAIKLLLKDAGAKGADAAVVQPAGLGARDTLRMEAGMPLYGHELTEEIDPLSAGLAWAVNLDKDQDENGEKFIGQDPLKVVAAAGPKQKLIGLKLDGKRTARQGMAVMKGDAKIGEVTSGCLSPTLEYPIAMAYVGAEHAAEGGAMEVDLGSARASATVVKLPFYKRATA